MNYIKLNAGIAIRLYINDGAFTQNVLHFLQVSCIELFSMIKRNYTVGTGCKVGDLK